MLLGPAHKERSEESLLQAEDCNYKVGSRKHDLFQKLVPRSQLAFSISCHHSTDAQKVPVDWETSEWQSSSSPTTAQWCLASCCRRSAPPPLDVAAFQHHGSPAQGPVHLQRRYCWLPAVEGFRSRSHQCNKTLEAGHLNIFEEVQRMDIISRVLGLHCWNGCRGTRPSRRQESPPRCLKRVSVLGTGFSIEAHNFGIISYCVLWSRLRNANQHRLPRVSDLYNDIWSRPKTIFVYPLETSLQFAGSLALYSKSFAKRSAPSQHARLSPEVWIAGHGVCHSVSLYFPCRNWLLYNSSESASGVAASVWAPKPREWAARWPEHQYELVWSGISPNLLYLWYRLWKEVVSMAEHCMACLLQLYHGRHAVPAALVMSCIELQTFQDEINATHQKFDA